MNRLSLTSLAIAVVMTTACAAAPADPSQHPLADQPIPTPQPPEPGAVDLPRYPSISPDGRAVCFSWRGDLWRVPTTGGLATRLTAHPLLEDHSVWSPDGRSIAFNSERSGYRNVYTMDADGSNLTPVTREDRYLYVHGWADDNTLSLTGYLEADVHKSPRPYTVATGGGSISRLHDAFGRSPVVSPDGRYVAFVRGRASWDKPFATNSDNRDLWLYDRRAQTFRQLTTNPGNDGKPRWLDNDTLLYLSARPPARVNLYRMDLETGEDESAALTDFANNDVQHFDVARNGELAVLHVWDTLYTLDPADDDAQPVALDITAPTDAGDRTLVRELDNNADQAALSPDGKVMAIGIHGDLFVRTVGSKNPPQRITRDIALDQEPAWSPDGRSLYFTSDRDGTLGIYRATVTLTRGDIERSLEAQIKTQGGDEALDESRETALDNAEEAGDQGVPAAEDGEDGKDGTADAPSPDRWHEAIRFDIEPVVVTESHDSRPSPSPDGSMLAFKRGNGSVALLDLESGQERVFHEGWDMGTHWAWSADGRYLALSYEDQDHNADIWVGLTDGSAPPVNITKHPGQDVMPSFSHDGKILAFLSNRDDDQYDAYAVYLDKSLETYTPQQLTEYYEQAAEAVKKLKPLGAEEDADDTDDQPGGDTASDGDNADATEPSADDTPAEAAETDASDSEVTEPDAPDEQDEPDEQADPRPLDLDDAYLRLRRLTSTRESEWDARIHPDGGRVVYTRGDTVYTIGWDGTDEQRLGDRLDPEHLSLTGSHLVARRGGTAVTVELNGGKTTEVQTPGSLRVDRRALQRERFRRCARAITRAFYDPTFKGIDWPAATKKYAQLAERTRTADEFDDVANRYLGLLNASHMGIRSPEPDAENSEPNGRLGARYERVDAGYEVVAIEPKTPAAEGPMRLQLGDVITAIGFEPIRADDTVTARLAGRVGRETAVTVLRQRGEGDQADNQPAELHLLLTPISYRAYDDIRYDNWQRAKRAKVNQWSGGRLGYIHIESMNQSSLAEFERDLYAACEGRDGLIIDVRDNGGGWTTDRLLASIMTRRHAYTVPRGADPTRTNSYPNSRLFITRYNLPINTLCNENSFSNAEIFSHAFKTLDRGTLVGNTTAGGVISTGRATLRDGTTVRLPFRGWYLPDGTDMENNGAVPHLLIPRTPRDEAAGTDAQLKAAVDDLLDRLER